MRLGVASDFVLYAYDEELKDLRTQQYYQLVAQGYDGSLNDFFIANNYLFYRQKMMDRIQGTATIKLEPLTKEEEEKRVAWAAQILNIKPVDPKGGEDG